jgi:para-nitrobenzyl esterase
MRIRRTLWAVAIAGVAGAAHPSTWDAPTQGSPCLVTTANGDVQGVDNGSSCAFLGIPFAAPPVGGLRWKPPQPAAAWAPATFNAMTAPPSCALINPPGGTATQGNEDCLKLNIWTPNPAPASPAPVIVWIHTGAFVAASASIPAHNGRNMAERTGAIVVAANYRVGPFGFLSHAALTAEDPSYRSSGNYGLLDQRAALAWVREHVAAFGGDPENVTIGGQSAGGHSVSLHVVSPGSAGYFHRAIMQSGYASMRWPTLADGEALGSRFAVALGCTVPSQVLDCMRSKNRNEVLLALPTGQQQFLESSRASWGPVVDRLEIPDQPRILYEHGAFNRVPLIIGATRNEGWIYADRSFPAGLTPEEYQAAVQQEFGAADAPAILAMYPAADYPSPKHALSQLAGDVEAVCEARRVARLVSRTGTPVYQYSFEREVAAVAGDQVIHGIDTNFTFGNNYAAPSNYVLNADDRALSGAIGDYWTRFAATGNPNVVRRHQQHAAGVFHADVAVDDENDDVVRWPASHGENGKYLALDVPIRQDKHLREPYCDFWEPFFLRSVVASVPASAPSNDLCGATIAADLKLNHDVACAGDGLIAGADGIRLNLNGHTITGSGIGSGISVIGHTGVSIFGGTIGNFLAGVRTQNTSGIVVSRNMFQQNADGIDLQSGSSGNTIKNNRFQANGSRGIMIRGQSTHHLIKDNIFTSNRVGILVFAGVENTVKDNFLSASVLAGIRFNVFAAGNIVRENTIVSNPAGIEFLITPTGSSTGNALVGNTIILNTCGIKGPVAGNTLKKNVFEGNSGDSCQ